jgi:hypothetical protein
VQGAADGEDEEHYVVHATAGRPVEGLALRCVDEAGRPASTGLAGRLMVSWATKAKKVVLAADEETRLPPMKARQAPRLWS